MQEAVMIVCPECRQPTAHIKRCGLLGMLYLFVFIRWQVHTIVRCPGCMRRAILQNALSNILTANLLFPFIILPVSLVHYAITFRQGHDQSALQEIAEAQKAATVTAEFAKQLEQIRRL